MMMADTKLRSTDIPVESNVLFVFAALNNSSN